MKPNLLIGDFLFVKKWSYGYSKHSLPFSIPIIKDRIFFRLPTRGDLVVFKTPNDNKTDYIKRIIGLPGDTIYIKNSVIYINDEPITKIQIEEFIDIDINYNKRNINQYEESLFNIKYKIIEEDINSIADNTGTYYIPKGHFFVMGDNRDNSLDSRFLDSVGYVPMENLVGKAWFVFFSLENSSFFEIWKWPTSLRYNRILNLL